MAMSTENWVAYNSQHSEFEFYETEQEAVSAAEEMLTSECEEGLPQEVINGGIKVFRVTHESAAIDTWTQEEEIARGGSGDFDTYHDMAMVKTEPPLYSPVKPEDVTEAWYWVRDKDGHLRYEPISVSGNGLDAFYSYYNASYRCWDDVKVADLFASGCTLYRIPELPDDLEVAE